MDSISKQFRLDTVIMIIFFAAAARILLPVFGYPANLAPIDAIALFSGAFCSRRTLAICVTLLSVWIGDLFIDRIFIGQWLWFYSGFYWQYACYILMVFIGSYLGKHVTVAKTASAGIAAALLFFIVSNFGVWLNWHLYPANLGGLITCYAAAIPFLKTSLLGNWFYSLILFGGFALIQKKSPRLTLKIGTTKI